MKAIIAKIRPSASRTVPQRLVSADLGLCEQELRQASDMMLRYLDSLAKQASPVVSEGCGHA